MRTQTFLMYLMRKSLCYQYGIAPFDYAYFMDGGSPDGDSTWR